MKPLLLVVLAFLVATNAFAAPPAEDLPEAIQAMSARGVTIDGSMPAPDGFKGYVGLFQGHKIPVYLLPDGQHVVVGSIYDAQGTDLTSATFRKASTPEFGDADWQKLAQSNWLPEGTEEPERIVYVFTDTECPYCHKLWQQAKGIIAGSQTQIRHIIVAVISPRSAPRAAAILGSEDPADALQQHERHFDNSPIADDAAVSAEIKTQLTAHAALMNHFGIFGTPGLVYRDAEGKVRVQAGVPRTEEALRTILLGE